MFYLVRLLQVLLLNNYSTNYCSTWHTVHNTLYNVPGVENPAPLGRQGSKGGISIAEIVSVDGECSFSAFLRI